MAKYIKGLNKDTGPIDQPEGTYRYAKNAIISKTKGAVSNEHGNSAFASVGSDHIILGTIEVTDGRIVIFSVGNLGSILGDSFITVLDGSTTTTILSTEQGNVINGNDVDLKFSKDSPIEGTYKIDPDENLIVYWTDNNNPPRTLNVTRQQSFTAPQTIYNKDPEDSPNTTYIDRLNLFPHAGPVPRIEFKSIASGGALKSGTYYLFLSYVDANFTQTNYVSFSLGVPIVEDDEAVRPIERYDGCPPDSQTGKSIVWSVDNLNTDYEYLRPVIVARISDDTERAYRLNDVDISGSTASVVFSMLEGYASEAVDTVAIDSVSYDTIKTLTQLDGILYLGNTSGSKDIGYQPNANFISLETVVDTLDPFDGYEVNNDNLQYGYLELEPNADIVKDQGFRDIHKLSSTVFNRRGYMRDEVYAFYIAFILNDGSMSYAYHIPGRTQYTDQATNQLGRIGQIALSELGGVVDEVAFLEDQDLIDLTQGHGQLFHFYDFSTFGVLNTNYWQNKNEHYPNTDNYKVFDGVNEVEDLGGTNVRHHRMPSNSNETRRTITDNADTVDITTEEVVNMYYIAFGSITDQDSGWLEEQGGTVPPTLILPQNDVYSPPTGLGIGDSGAMAGTGSTPSSSNAWNDALIAWYGIDDNDWVSASPSAGQQGYMVWSKADEGGLNVGNSGGTAATIISSPGEISAEYILEQDGGVLGDADEDNINGGFGSVIYVYFVWAEVSQAITGGGVISQAVDALGIKLSDIQIPYNIAQKVQGFKVYYAERDHANRRILGQDVLKNTQSDGQWEGVDLGGCGSETGNGAQEDFILSPGSLYSGKITTATFHDHYLLNTRNSLIPATHTTYEYNVEFLSFLGAGHHYSDVDNSLEENCQVKESFVAAHIGRSYQGILGSAYPVVHYPLREKCKTYIDGDSIYDGRALGFGKRIYNLGGESSILLGYKISRLPAYAGWVDAGSNITPWHDQPGAQAPFSYQEATSPVRLQIHNLQAFKTDMYLSVDTQNLVWTGYEVLGDDLDNFTLNEDGTRPTSVSGVFGQTGDIYGGDTFICRHGYRITHRPEMFDEEPADHKSVLYVICESTHNINFRHEVDVDSSYFPGSPAKKVLDIKASINLTGEGNMNYSEAYTLGVSDFKPPFPLPLRESDPTIFKTRIQRSAKADNVSLIDNYRVFLSQQSKDLPRNRGDIWKLVSFNNLLYIHTEDSLFKTKGKQAMKLTDGSQSYIGSGDIFSQEPDELVQTAMGYGGTNSQWASLVTKHGYFFVDYKNAKVFLVTDTMHEISKLGLEEWFNINIPYALAPYGIPADIDNPIQGIGLHSVWDDAHDRILLTKRDIVPTDGFLALVAVGVADADRIIWDDESKHFLSPPSSGSKIIEWTDSQYFTATGWTVSFLPQAKAWVSFHDYVPYIYTYTDDRIFSVPAPISGSDVSDYLWGHTEVYSPGQYYRETYPFEFEFIFNKAKDASKIFYNFSYTVDVFTDEANNQANITLHNPGFTSFYVYSTYQISDEQDIEYLINIRRTSNSWKVNKFRDLARLQSSSDNIYTGGAGGHVGSNFGVTGANVAGTITQNVVTTTLNTMFTVSGMNETINNTFIDLTKSWNNQKKFTDKWVGIRLKANNLTNNLINLYATDVAAKKFYR